MIMNYKLNLCTQYPMSLETPLALILTDSSREGVFMRTMIPSHSSCSSSINGVIIDMNFGSDGPGNKPTRMIFSLRYRSCLGRFWIVKYMAPVEYAVPRTKGLNQSTFTLSKYEWGFDKKLWNCSVLNFSIPRHHKCNRGILTLCCFLCVATVHIYLGNPVYWLEFLSFSSQTYRDIPSLV